MAWYNPATWTVVDNLQGQNKKSTGGNVNNNFNQPIADNPAIYQQDPTQVRNKIGGVSYNYAGQPINPSLLGATTGGATTGGGGGYDAEAAAEKAASEARIARARQASKAFIGDILGVYEDLYGGVGKAAADQTARLNQRYDKEVSSLTDQFNQELPTIGRAHAGRGTYDSSFRIDDEFGAKTGFENQLSDIGTQKAEDAAKIGQFVATERASINAGRAGVNDIMARLNDVQDEGEIIQLQNELSNKLRTLQAERATNLTQNEYVKQAQSLAPTGDRLASLQQTLSGIIQGQAPGPLKQAIAEQVIGSSGLSEEDKQRLRGIVSTQLTQGAQMTEEEKRRRFELYLRQNKLGKYSAGYQPEVQRQVYDVTKEPERRNTFQRVRDQLNPFDAGRSYGRQYSDLDKARQSLRAGNEQLRNTEVKFGPLRDPAVKARFLREQSKMPVVETVKPFFGAVKGGANLLKEGAQDFNRNVATFLTPLANQQKNTQIDNSVKTLDQLSKMSPEERRKLAGDFATRRALIKAGLDPRDLSDQALNARRNDLQGRNRALNQPVKVEGPANKLIYGTDVQDVFTRTKTTAEDLQKYGINPKASKFVAPVAVLLALGLDLIPNGGSKVAKQGGEKVLREFAEADSAKLVKEIAEREGAQMADDVAEKVAQTTNPEEIKRLLTNAVKGADNVVKPVAQTAAKQVAEQVAESTVKNTPQFTDNIVRELTKNKDPKIAREAIEALFPQLDNTSKDAITKQIAEGLDEDYIRKSLEKAEARRIALSEGIDQAKPVADDTVKPIEQIAETTPTAPTEIKQAPNPDLQQANLEWKVSPETDKAVNQLVEEASQKPPAKGTKRLYQGIQGNSDTPWYFDSPEALKRFFRSDSDVNFKFVDVPKRDAIPVPNKPGEFLVEGGNNINIFQKLSPDRIIRENITNPIENAINKGIAKAQTSDNVVARLFGRATTGVSREAGVSQDLLAAKRRLRGGIERGKLTREEIYEAGADLASDSRKKVWSILDPDQAKKIGVNPARVEDLTEPERRVYDHLETVINNTTQGNLQRNLITPSQASNRNYIKRGYSVFEESSDQSKAYNQTRANLLEQFKKRKDVDEDLLKEAITDPVYLVAKKQAESEAAWAMVDYGKWLDQNGYVSDVAKSGYRQLPQSKVFGPAAGKYVPATVAEDFTGFQYSNGMLNAYNDLASAYDRLAIRRAKKATLTVANPAVRAGNQFSNRIVFSNMNGINPLQFNKNMQVAKKLINTKDPIYKEFVSQGLTGIDITQADFAKRLFQSTGDQNIAKKGLEWIKSSYSKADDQARFAAYITHRNRGYSAEEAARLTQRGFQDYSSVGFFFDLAAKTPLIGNAFVRFAGDAIRIGKNAALDHPLRAAATIGAWALFVDQMSKLSGETPEDRATREDRFGAPKLPFTDISTEVQTPWGAVNVARFLPFYQLNDIQSGIGKFLPIQQNPFSPEGWQDPLLGQFAQLVADKDFRKKSIADPENTGQFVDELSNSDRNKNRARFLATQNLPLGRELDSLISAATGNKDIYGKVRSVPQALFRAGGVKVEQFGPEQAAKQRDTNAYFKEKEQLDKDLANLPKGAQEAYKRVTGYYKLRDKTTNEFDTTKQRNVKAPVYKHPEDKWRDYVQHPELYDLMVAKKEKEAATSGKPIQPEFDKRLSAEFRKQLISNKSLAPGEDVEADQRMYQSSEWQAYQQLKKQYTKDAKKYYPDNGGDFSDETVSRQNSAFPDKPAAKKAYDEAYKAYAEGRGPKPEFTDAVAAAKEAYENAKWKWTNIERRARGLPPISKEVWDNVTFGFTSDEEKVYKELKYGKGYGRFGYGSKKEPKKPRLYLGQLLAGDKKPNVKTPKVSSVPTRTKFKVNKPRGVKTGKKVKIKLQHDKINKEKQTCQITQHSRTFTKRSLLAI